MTQEPDQPTRGRVDLRKAAFSAFMDEFVAESDRAAVVLGAAKIDALLCSVLDRHFIAHPGSEDDLLEGDSPLATFSARIKICQRLGLVDSNFAKLLHLLRRLRNAFAHEVAHSSLSRGAARDRVLMLAQPFAKADFFQGLLATVSSKANRTPDDASAIFRTVLAIFYIELHSILDAAETIKPSGRDGIVEAIHKRQRPKREDIAGEG